MKCNTIVYESSSSSNEALTDDNSVTDTLDASKATNAEERGKYLYNMFMSEYGLTKEQALGAVSALYQEANGWDPKTENSSSHAMGICQWYGEDTRKKVANYINNEFKVSKYNADNITAATFNEQVSYMKYQLSTNKSEVIPEIKKCADSVESARTWAAMFERGNYTSLNDYLTKHSRNAEKILKGYVKPIPTVKDKLGV